MRMGKKKQPTYRVVAADSRSPRNGRFIEIIGFYEPRQDPSVVRVKNDRAVHWLRHGAQPSDRVLKLLKISGAWDEFKNPDATPSAPATSEEPPAAAAAGDASADDAAAEASGAAAESATAADAAADDSGAAGDAADDSGAADDAAAGDDDADAESETK